MRRGWAVSGCLALSCAGEGAPVPPAKSLPPPPMSSAVSREVAPPTTVSVTRADERAPSTALDAACTSVRAAQEKVLRRARTESEELRGASDRVPPIMGSCLRRPRTRGAWVVALDSLAEGGCADHGCSTLRWHVMHLDDDGSRSEGPVRSQIVTAGSLVLDLGAIEDWDGDGTPELLVRTSTGHVACGRATTAVERTATLWSFHTGAIALSPLVVEDARDADQDGRLELVTRGPYVGVADRPCMANARGDSSLTLLGPELLLRADASGRFTLDPRDARAACPEAPPAVVARPKKGRLDVLLTARNVACARMWGATTEDIAAELDRHRATLCDQERGRCAEIDILRDWATREPPVLLTR